jgi:BNR/Asp-box repeat protein
MIVMGNDLTKQYSFLFEKKGGKQLISFVYDVYKSGKLREIFSFILWELFHRARLFSKNNYLKFNPGEAITLENTKISSFDFDEEIGCFLGKRELSATRSDHNWKLLYFGNPGEILGCLYPDDCNLYKSTDNGKSIISIKRFPQRIKSIFISSQNTIFVCTEGFIYKSSDDGASFTKSLDLGSTESTFRFNNAMTEAPNRVLILGEYGNVWGRTGWKNLAYLYFSFDGGETWKKSDFLIRKGINKHVHLVKYSRLLNKMLVADGDNKKKLWIGDLPESANIENPPWEPVNRFHIQMGGYTSIAENDEKILLGTDYQGGTNFIVETSDGEKFTKRIVPDPYRRSPIDNMVQRKSRNGNEVWANLPYSTEGTKCLLMYTKDGGKSWNRVIEYNRSTHTVWLINSSNEAKDELYYSIKDLMNNDRVVYKISDH